MNDWLTLTADIYHILLPHHHWNAISISCQHIYVKFIINTINEVIHEKYDRFIYLFNHFPLLSIDFPIGKMRCKLGQTLINRPAMSDHMWPLTVADSYKEPQLHFSIDASFMCNSHQQNWVLMVANVILLVSFHSYLALINYSHPLANEIIGKFCRVSALTPASINRESSFISMWKACARWYVVRSIAFSFNSRRYYRSLNCSQIIKKPRQECLTSDNNNSTIADLQQKT